MTPLPNKLKKYKNQIKPKTYYPDLLTDYLHCKYNCKDITGIFKDKFEYKVIMENLRLHFGNVDNICPIVIEIIRDDKSEQLYQDYDGSDKSYLYAFLDKQSGFFDSNSNELLYELTMEKSVSKEDYDKETIKLIEILSMMYTEKNGINDDDILGGNVANNFQPNNKS